MKDWILRIYMSTNSNLGERGEGKKKNKLIQIVQEDRGSAEAR